MPERALPTPLTAGAEVACAQGAHPSDSTQQPLLAIETHPAGDHTSVAVSGAIDMISEQELQDALRDALSRSVHGIELDLSAVDFCDCSGLAALLRTRRRAHAAAKDLTVHSPSTAVRRLLEATGTLTLLTAAEGHDETPDTDAQDLRTENLQLKRAMQTRPVIDMARGILMATFNISATDAWTVLVEVSQNTNTKLHEVADGLADAVNGGQLPEAYRQHIATTITKLQNAHTAPRNPEKGPAVPTGRWRTCKGRA
ncbi:anti-sigma factor antagonist [Streptomyces sp. Lzd4kr]|nr:anti-sigma factor antagonist [Streptomyces sp. Lzd4kr]